MVCSPNSMVSFFHTKNLRFVRCQSDTLAGIRSIVVYTLEIPWDTKVSLHWPGVYLKGTIEVHRKIWRFAVNQQQQQILNQYTTVHLHGWPTLTLCLGLCRGSWVKQIRIAHLRLSYCRIFWVPLPKIILTVTWNELNGRDNSLQFMGANSI